MYCAIFMAWCGDEQYSPLRTKERQKRNKLHNLNCSQSTIFPQLSFPLSFVFLVVTSSSSSSASLFFFFFAPLITLSAYCILFHLIRSFLAISLPLLPPSRLPCVLYILPFIKLFTDRYPTSFSFSFPHLFNYLSPSSIYSFSCMFPQPFSLLLCCCFFLFSLFSRSIVHSI